MQNWLYDNINYILHLCGFTILFTFMNYVDKWQAVDG
jgi:hypothetical protein